MSRRPQRRNRISSLFDFLLGGSPLLLLIVATLPASAKRFTIRGEIEGLVKGDTVRFERIELPGWELQPAFETVVTEPDRFEYMGRQEHAEYLMMTCTGAPEASRSGLTMIVDGGTVTIKGRKDEVYFSRVYSRVLDEYPALRELDSLETEVDKESNRYVKLMREAIDPAKRDEYMAKYHEPNPRLGDMKTAFLAQHPSSPWSIVERLETASYAPVDTLAAHYARLDKRARKSYYGTLLGKEIDRMRSVQPGAPAPDFTVELPDGRTLTAKDFRGKYLLIYHWGFCPGSMQLEKEAVEMYNRHKDRIEILGVTESLDAIRRAAAQTDPADEYQGINIKATFRSMSAHPWLDTEDVAEIDEKYVFAGYPFFILVSPDGKIVSRGFHETFHETKETLEEESK